MKVCIIGCGVAGLGSIRRCIEYDVECVAFEQTGEVGGLWVYKENTGIDEYGVPAAGSIYSSLRTNIPKMLMEYPGYPFVGTSDTLFPSHTEVRDYIEQFADKYGLKQYVKFYHQVQLVERCDGTWKVRVKYLKTGEVTTLYFDAIIVATGHYTVPNMPKIKGIEEFESTVMHVHSYRKPDIFRDKKVLIIGSGASGMDLTFEFRNVTQKTYFSHHNAALKDGAFPDNVVQKSDVLFVTKDEVHFVDGSSENVDIILFCTGYRYSFPYLDSSCGIDIEGGNVLRPLYNHMINVNNPTMCFIGFIRRSFVFITVDTQVQVFLKGLKGLIQLPSREEMEKAWKAEEEEMKQEGIPEHKYHDFIARSDIGFCRKYIRGLEEFASLQPMPEVYFKIYQISSSIWRSNYANLRKQNYKILDDDNLIHTSQN